MLTAKGRVEWSEGDTVVISQGATPTRNNIKNIDQGNQNAWGAIYFRRIKWISRK